MDWKKVWDLSQALNFQKEKFSICPVGYRAEVTRDQQNPISKTKHYQINKSEFRMQQEPYCTDRLFFNRVTKFCLNAQAKQH